MVALAQPAPLIAEVVTGADRLEGLAGEWSSLLTRSDQGSPSVSPVWLSTWWRVFGGLDGRALRAILFRRAGRLVGLVPLAVRRVWLGPGIPIRRLELLPSGEATVDEIASDYLGVVAERGYEQRIADRLAEVLGSPRFDRWDELVMPALGMDGVMVPLLAAALERVGSVRIDVTGGSPYISLPATWDDYLARLSGSRRRLIRTSLKSFDAWTGGHARLHLVRTPGELERGFRVLRDLHEERWRAAGKWGVFASQRFTAFHRSVMPALLADGNLELLWLSAFGRPVAALYNIVWNDGVHFYQSGRCMDLPPAVRPGLVLHALAIRRSIECGRREYDFLPGTSRYKLDLALSVRPIARLRVVRARPLRVARRAYERASGLWRAATFSRRKS